MQNIGKLPQTVPSLSVKIFDSLESRYQISVTFWFNPVVSDIDNQSNGIFLDEFPEFTPYYSNSPHGHEPSKVTFAKKLLYNVSI